MAKPATLDGYSDKYTVECERVLVTLLRGLGPWKDSVYLVGGLTPRYLVATRPPNVPAHAGTLDVDIVIDLQILADTEAYRTLEDNFKKMGFERAENEKQQKLSWRWQTRTEQGALMVLELLADAPDIAGGKVQPLPTDGTISALNIPHSSIVFDLHDVAEIQAELLGGNGVATEKIKHANLVSFTCLKSFAFDQRFERKDAHDLIYCIEHAAEGIDVVAQAFRNERGGKHGAVVESSLAILRGRFTDDDKTEGFRKDGPVAVAKFELGEGDEPEQREARALRQRQASDVISRLLDRVAKDEGAA
ncbi:antitoxin [Ramlibacter sp.]|uniref:antitoxin n=1 Tax=Ramlibacter sp. TaxID=1917967 RepID=UPI003D0A7C51